MTRTKISLSIFGSTLLGFALPGIALAQDQSLVLEEIIVTAQKKAETLAEAPLTVNVIEGKDIRELTMFDATDLSKITSGVEVRNEGDSNTGIAIRGVGTLAQQPAPSRVGVYLDDWYGGPQSQFVFQQMFDLSRVQILRGPQGTLYGQPSPAGALLVETANPNLSEIDGYISATYQNPDGYNIQGGVSIPLIEDELGLRISGLLDDRDTGLDNIVRNEDNEINNRGFRVKTLWTPNDEFSAKLGWTYVEMSDSDTYRPLESVTSTANFQLDASDRTSIQDAPDQMNNREDNLYTMHLDWNPGPVEVNFFAAYHDPKVDSISDEDGTELPGQTVRVVGEGKEGQQYELRLIAQPLDWWDGQIGAYYAEEANDTDVEVLAAGPGLVAALELTIPTDNKVTAFFTHNDFHISETTTITAGLRFNKFENSSPQGQTTELRFGSEMLVGGGATAPISSLIVPCSDGSAPPCIVEAAETVEEWTGTIKVSHALSDDHNLYATIDRGFRPGAANFDISGATGPELQAYSGESVDSFEVGLKGALMGGRAQYSVATFYVVYEDYQINPSFQHWDPNVNGPSDINIVYVNVDEAEQYGIEGEFTVLLAENWSLFTALGWNNVEFTDGVVPCNDPNQPALSVANPFNVCEAKGQAAGSQPQWSWVVQSEYWRPLEAINGEWFVNGLFNYRGESEVPGDPQERLSTEDYIQLDIFAGVRNENWTARVFVKNVFDDADIVSKRALGTDYNDLTLVAPRTTGVTLAYQF